MRIGIITYYGVHSHGAVLQANALKTVLENMGHQVEFLTFDRNYDFIPKENSKKYKIGLNSIPFYTKYLLEKGPTNIVRNIQKNNTLNQYRKRQFQMGSRYSDFDGDLVIVGSDEVFSLEIGINPFMYGHGIHDGIPIISYAGCFGPTTIQDIREKGESDLISSGIKKMSAVSVRDMNSQSIVRELTNIEVSLVCDPVFLYGYKNEIKSFIPKDNKYVLIYSYDRNMNEEEEINQIIGYKKRNNLKAIAVGYPHKWCDKYADASPEELIGYIKQASLVITDTFHGTVLSLLCNTDFIVKLRTNSNKLGYLLEEYGQSDRIVHSFDEIDKVVNRGIDFKAINAMIEKKRAFSIEFLRNSLRAAKKE